MPEYYWCKAMLCFLLIPFRGRRVSKPCTVMSSRSNSPATSVSSLRKPNTLLEGLYDIYEQKILPVESGFKFEAFYSPLLTENEFRGKPLVLLLGQYSTGKTTFIQSILGRDYPGGRVGPEPTTDRFVSISAGGQDRIIPGNALVIQPDKPFGGLAQFGATFLSKFQASELSHPLLDCVTFVDTPGVLSGDKQKNRNYDYPGVMRWFADHADLILVFFDAHKLDVSDEFKDVLKTIESNEEKVRIILNKADQCPQLELMRVYGALMWSLGRLIRTPEVPRIYVSTFRTSASSQENPLMPFLMQERQDLIDELKGLPVVSATRKVNDVVKRARLARVHAILMNHLRTKMPTFFNRSSRQTQLIDGLAKEFEVIQKTYAIPPGDCPSVELLSETLKNFDLSLVPKLKSDQLMAVESAIKSDIPNLMAAFPMAMGSLAMPVSKNPFGLSNTSITSGLWDFEYIDHEANARFYESLHPVNGKLAGTACKEFFLQSGLDHDEIARIWEMSDLDADGKLTQPEFSIMLHLIQLAMGGVEIPKELPPTLLPTPATVPAENDTAPPEYADY